ncbi:MAG: hypothetical protein ACD_58C00006G0002 [uncultured bacterium]|nr:MAG: hypothetical protein ACD_58C00006G0002 [uncultured bacterium]
MPGPETIGLDAKMAEIRKTSEGNELKMGLERKINGQELLKMINDFVQNDFGYSEPITFNNKQPGKDPKELLKKNLIIIEGLKETNITPKEFLEKACVRAIARVADLAFDEESILGRFEDHYGVKITLKDMSSESKQEVKEIMTKRLEHFIKEHARTSEKANPQYPLGVINDLIESGIMDENDKDKYFQMVMDELCSTHREVIFKDREDRTNQHRETSK